MLALLLIVASVVVALADTFTISFESPTYTAGTIHNQDGWSSSGAAGSGCAVYDHAVAAVNATVQGLAPSFGSQALRISNAVASGCFGDQTFSRSLANDAGEAGAQGGGMSGGTRQGYFEAEWDFISTVPGAEQTGLSVVASPDRGDGARMSWVQMADTSGGIDINFFDYQKGPNGPDDFVQRPVSADLPRNVPHKIKVTMHFLEGPANDIVTVSVDGVQRLVGTSWEDYFRDQETNPTRPVDSVLFRTSVAAAGTAGQGFYIDNLKLTSGAPPARASVFVRTDGNDVTCDRTTNAAATTDGKCAFKTIARGLAVVDAGGTVTVGAGPYPESLVLTGKAVTITGAGTGQTILEGANTRTIGISSSVNESNLTVQDLTIQNYTQYGVHFVTGALATVKFEDVEILSNGIHGFWSQSFDVNGLTLNRVTASNNNALPNAAANGRGAWIINGTRQNVLITNSTFNNNRLVGLDLSDGETLSTTISGNTIVGNGDSGLAVLGAEGTVTLASNTITNNGRYGIEMKVPGGLTSGTPTIVVENNTVSRTVDATDARDHGGIVVIRRSQVTPINADQPSGVLIQNNVVSGYRRKPSGATGDGFGIVVTGTNMVARNNILDNNDVAIQAQAGNTPDVQSTDFFDRDSSSAYSGVIELNDVKSSNSIGIRTVGVAGTPDTTRNWFGASSGPTNAANAGGTGSSVVGNADFDPWLCSGTDTSGAVGFQPNAALTCPASQPPLGNVFVRTDGDNTVCNGSANVAASDAVIPNCAVKTIAKGISIATTGGTVNVGPGTYAENVAVNKAVTLLGNNQGIDPRTGGGARSAESVVDGGGVTAAFAIGANAVTINGFTIKGGAGALGTGVHSPPTMSGWQILNNIVTDNVIGVYAQCGGSCTLQRNLFNANNRPGAAGGSGIYTESSTGMTVDQNEFMGHTSNSSAIFAAVTTGAHQNLQFTNNSIHDNPATDSEVYVVSVSNGTFSGNTISNPNGAAMVLASGNSTVAIQNNTFTGGLRGVRMENDGFGFPDNTGVTLTGNVFGNNAEYGLGVNAGGHTGALNIEKNWWGNQRGPTVAANPGGTGAAQTGAQAGLADFSPWCATQACTGTFNAIPTRLVFTSQPGNTTEGTAFTPQPVVRAEDVDGNLGINFGGPVALALGANGENAALTGSATVSAVDGVATFTGLGVSDNGTGLTIAATATGLTGATSTGFDSANAIPAVTVTAPANNSTTLIGRQVTATATFTDGGTNDTHTCTIAWGDGAQTAGTVVEPAGGNPGSCTASHNYAAVGNGQIQVTVSDDDTGAGNAAVALSRTQGTILLSKTSLTTTEAGGTDTFTVALNAAPTANVTINVSSSNTSEGTVSPTTLTFTPANGTQPQTVTVTGQPGGLQQGNDAYNVIVGAASSSDIAFNSVSPPSVLSATNQGTAAPVVSIANAGLPAAPTATTPLNFTVSLNAASSRLVTVSYATANGTATSGADYLAASGVLTFNPGETTKTVPIQILANTANEADEQFFVDLSSPNNATIGTTRATGTITGAPIGVLQPCERRPDVSVQTQVTSGRRASITIRAGTASPNGDNRLVSIQFGTPRNATLLLNGQAPGTGPITLPTNTLETVFTVQQTDPNAAFHVPFTVVDSCGSTEKFVGGGKDAYVQ